MTGPDPSLMSASPHLTWQTPTPDGPSRRTISVQNARRVTHMMHPLYRAAAAAEAAAAQKTNRISPPSGISSQNRNPISVRDSQKLGPQARRRLARDAPAQRSV